MNEECKNGINRIDLLDLFRFIESILFFLYGIDELRFREIGTKTCRLINIKYQATKRE